MDNFYITHIKYSTKKFHFPVSHLDYGNGGSGKDEVSSGETSGSIKDSLGENLPRGSLQPVGPNSSQSNGRPLTPPHSSDRDRDRGDKDKSGKF